MDTASTRNPIDTPYSAGFLRNADDWSVLGPVTVVQHHPSKTVFQVSVDLNKDLDETLALEDFRAALVHYCGGLDFPAPLELQRLHTEAVLVSLFHAGLVTFEQDADNDQCEGSDDPF